MSLLALMMLAGGKTLKSKVFPVGTTPWKPPLGVTRLEKAVGKGQDGTPGATFYEVSEFRQTITYFDNGTISYGTVFLVRRYETPSSNTPATYYDNYQEYPDRVSEDKHSFSSRRVTQPAFTGAATTGFNLTFPGGVGVSASSRQFESVAVSSATTYNVTVAPGGNLTIFYFE